jgi:threonine dehydratase
LAVNTEPLAIALNDIEIAAENIRNAAVRTPLLENRALNEQTGGRLLLKPEMLQVTGSFKFRGAYNCISSLDADERNHGVIAFSSGNHAQGVAAAAHFLGCAATIVMPDDAPAVKVDGTRGWGAEVVTYDRAGGDSREEITEALAQSRGLTLVRPFDDPRVIAGQGTAGLEITAQCDERGLMPDAVLVPCGGGGLVSGIATAVSAHWPEAAVHPVEPDGFDDTARSLKTGERQRNDGPEQGLCDALLSPMPGRLTFPVVQRFCAPGLVVSDEEVFVAMRAAFANLKLVVEPGGAVALAAALAGKLDLKGKTAVVVMSGGNVDPALFVRAIAASVQ